MVMAKQKINESWNVQYYSRDAQSNEDILNLNMSWENRDIDGVKIAQLVEHHFGKVEVTSSILVVSFASIAQLDRAPDFGSGGCGFESFLGRYTRVAQLDRATAF
jgi:hypothetical protein